jgi:hypothetical protein
MKVAVIDCPIQAITHRVDDIGVFDVNIFQIDVRPEFTDKPFRSAQVFV